MYVTYLSSKPKILSDILDEFHEINNKFEDEKAQDLDDVIAYIDEI